MLISTFRESRNVKLTAGAVLPYTAVMDETEYRQSRICRLLGNPVIYQLIVLLDNGGPTTPSMLAKRAGRSVQTSSTHVAKLRTADLVRYDSDGKNVRYWLKHRGNPRAFGGTGKDCQIGEPIRLGRHFHVSRILKTCKFPL
jgi:hypothetical protein